MGAALDRLTILPIKASLRHEVTEKAAGVLRSMGQLPVVVNDVYLPLLTNPWKERIQILYGGAGSGKSDFKATELLIKALTAPFFRCLFVRKHQITVRDSQFALLCDLIKRYEFTPFFKINRSDMDITCTMNGNALLSGGLDDVDKLKSIPDLTDIWIEEPIDRKGSVKESDFTELNRRLRCEKAPNHIHLTFNPVAKESWIYRLFFARNIYDARALKTTYLDNLYTPVDMAAQFDALRLTHPEEYAVYALGEWGSMDDIENRLFQEDSILDLFTNSFIQPTGTRYLTADVAFSGVDKFVIMVWDGWTVIDVLTYAKSEGDEIVNKIREVASEYAIPGQRIAFDAGGVGIALRGFLRSSVSFVGSAAPIETNEDKKEYQKKVLARPQYRNLRAQCYHYAATKVNDCEAYFAPESGYLREQIGQEMRAIRKVDMLEGGKYQIVKKEEIKDRIGRSPDLADTFSMRAIFDLLKQKKSRRRTAMG